MENKPEMKFRAGSVVATVWKNDVQRGKEKVALKSVQLQRLYKDGNDEWQSSGSFRPQDLPVLASLVQRVYEELAVKQE